MRGRAPRIFSAQRGTRHSCPRLGRPGTSGVLPAYTVGSLTAHTWDYVANCACGRISGFVASTSARPRAASGWADDYFLDSYVTGPSWAVYRRPLEIRTHMHVVCSFGAERWLCEFPRCAYPRTAPKKAWRNCPDLTSRPGVSARKPARIAQLHADFPWRRTVD